MKGCNGRQKPEHRGSRVPTSGFLVQNAMPSIMCPVQKARTMATRKPERFVQNMDSCILQGENGGLKHRIEATGSILSSTRWYWLLPGVRVEFLGALLHFVLKGDTFRIHSGKCKRITSATEESSFLAAGRSADLQPSSHRIHQQREANQR